jgi:multidrug transporter EmrE-like cation transporter
MPAVPAGPGAPGAVLATAGLVAAGTLLPFTLFAYAQSRVPAEVAGAFLNLEPLVGAVAGVVVFGDPAGPGQLAGGAAILAGIALSGLPLLATGRRAATEGAAAGGAPGHGEHLADAFLQPQGDQAAGCRGVAGQGLARRGCTWRHPPPYRDWGARCLVQRGPAAHRQHQPPPGMPRCRIGAGRSRHDPITTHGSRPRPGGQPTATTIFPAAEPSSMARCASAISPKPKTRTGLDRYRPASALAIISASGISASGKRSVPSTKALP